MAQAGIVKRLVRGEIPTGVEIAEVERVGLIGGLAVAAHEHLVSLPRTGSGVFLRIEHGRRQVIAGIVGIHGEGQSLLPKVVGATDPLRPVLGVGQGRQQHPGQNRDDGDHHQQFDQRESRTRPAAGTLGFHGTHLTPSAPKGKLPAEGEFPGPEILQAMVGFRAAAAS